MNMNQKRFVNIVIIILAVAIAGTIGYFAFAPTTTNNPTTTPPQNIPQNVTQENINDCNLISNSSFRSINQYEVGLGPNGPAMGYWVIQFQNSTIDYGKPTFQWSHSDVSESGTYTCKGDVLQVKFFDHSITAYYDGSKKVLIWDGVEYKKAE